MQVCHQAAPVGFNKLHQVSENQNRCNLIFVETTCIKILGKLAFLTMAKIRRFWGTVCPR